MTRRASVGWTTGASGRSNAAVTTSLCAAIVASCLAIIPLAALAQTNPPGLGLRGSVGDLSLPKGALPMPGDQAAPTPSTPASPPPPAVPSTPGIVPLSLSAQLSDDTPKIDAGLVWHVFQETLSASGRAAKHVTTEKDASPVLKLAPGNYVVAAGYGRATMTRRFVLRPGKPLTETFVLNAGGLKVTAVLGESGPIPPGLVTYDILGDERDQSGNRARIASLLRPGVVVRLNAGVYHIVSNYGDTNVQVRADVTVEAGKMSDATISHAAGRVTFKLVSKAGGEAHADTLWTISTLNGVMVKESAGAIPAHSFAPGNYSAVAKSGGKAYRRDFSITAGDNVELEIVKN